MANLTNRHLGRVTLVSREGRYEHDLMKVHAYSYIDTTPNYILQGKVSVQ
jgi:hypothetical protein